MKFFGRIGKNWKGKERIGKIEKIWNLDFVSLNHPGTH